MNLIEILAGPLIGAVIGYFTNYIAVKMLFHPLKPVKIGGKVLPFTPGMIPKGKPRLAKALGKAVGEKLFTHEDLKEILLSREIKESVLDTVVKGIREVQNSQDSLETFLEQYIDPKDYEHMRSHLEDLLTEKITQGLEKLETCRVLLFQGNGAALPIDEAVGTGALGPELSGGMVQNPVAEAEADKGFISPLADGDEVYSFLDVYGGSSLEGVVLAGPAGSAVVAADSGHVIDLPMDKYGKGVKILHDDGYYTVYEGLERILVRQAEKVSKGQPIGSIGTSQTYFGRPAVFFQIEQEGVKIDPALMVKGL